MNKEKTSNYGYKGLNMSEVLITDQHGGGSVELHIEEKDACKDQSYERFDKESTVD